MLNIQCMPHINLYVSLLPGTAHTATCSKQKTPSTQFQTPPSSSVCYTIQDQSPVQHLPITPKQTPSRTTTTPLPYEGWSALATVPRILRERTQGSVSVNQKSSKSDNWVQCDSPRCNKWRKVHHTVLSVTGKDDPFRCEMLHLISCKTPEEPWSCIPGESHPDDLPVVLRHNQSGSHLKDIGNSNVVQGGGNRQRRTQGAGAGESTGSAGGTGGTGGETGGGGRVGQGEITSDSDDDIPLLLGRHKGGETGGGGSLGQRLSDSDDAIPLRSMKKQKAAVTVEVLSGSDSKSPPQVPQCIADNHGQLELRTGDAHGQLELRKGDAPSGGGSKEEGRRGGGSAQQEKGGGGSGEEEGRGGGGAKEDRGGFSPSHRFLDILPSDTPPATYTPSLLPPLPRPRHTRPLSSLSFRNTPLSRHSSLTPSLLPQEEAARKKAAEEGAARKKKEKEEAAAKKKAEEEVPRPLDPSPFLLPRPLSLPPLSPSFLPSLLPPS